MRNSIGRVLDRAMWVQTERAERFAKRSARKTRRPSVPLAVAVNIGAEQQSVSVIKVINENLSQSALCR